MAPRGRRRTRTLLPSASASEGPPPFDPDWSAIGLAYGHELNDEVRCVIAGIVERYLDEELLEAAAQPLDEVAGWGEGLARDARALAKSLSAARGNDGRERILDAIEIAAPPGHFFHDAAHHMQSLLLWFARHADAEIAEVKKHSAGAGFKDGAAWDEMVVALTAELGSRGLPTRVANSSNARNPKPSQFLRLIQALDVCGLRLSHEDGALAVAINKARRRRSGRAEIKLETPP